MRVLLPTPGSADDAHGGDVDLHAHYANGWTGRGGMRANFVASVDGAAAVAGLSRGLQTPGDNRVFAALRDLADVVVVGASTAHAEAYRPAAPSAERRAVRARYGLRATPAIAVVSRTLDVDLSLEVFAAARPDTPALIITTPAAPADRRDAVLAAAAEGTNIQLIDTPSLPYGEVSMRAVVRQLAALGYRHQLCEGGPRLFAAAVLDGAVDELCLSVSPMLTGPGSTGLTAGSPWPVEGVTRMKLVGLLCEDDALFCRYTLE